MGLPGTRKPAFRRMRNLSIAILSSASAAFLVTACLEQAPSEPATSELSVALAVTPGTYSLQAVHRGQCVDVAAASTADGAKLQQWGCNGNNNQKFTISQVATGIYEARAVHSGKCVDVAGWSTANGGLIHQWSCRGQANQRWRVTDLGSGQYQFKSVHSSKCLDVKGVSTADGAAIQQYTCYNVPQQKFRLVTSTGGGDGGGITWKKANLTWFTSYPDPGSEECIKYNGCTWAGYFAGVDGKMSEDWVRSHNIIAVHEKHFSQYRLKTFRIKQGTRQIDATVYDMCSDSDCNGCCTANLGTAGFLIDMEKYTKERFGSGSGTVDWYCTNCN